MRILPLPLLALLAACGPDLGPAGAGSLHAEDYLPPLERFLQLGPQDAPADGPWLMIEVGEDSWELREGMEWNQAERQEQLEIDDEDGLRLAGSLLLPAELAEGTEQDGTTVLSLGEEEVYYGGFDLAVRTEVPSGRFGGEWTFAQGVGPIALTVDGQRWELVYYE
jgi:hypothetical protein